MILCLNPPCSAPNAPDTKFCIRCGTKLLIQECYQPIKELGVGAFGKTFLAVNTGNPSQPECVIKQFIFTSGNPNLVQKAKELFYQEAQQLKKLGKHDQIPELYTYHEQENRLYLIQEFVNGKNLLEELSQDGVFSAAKVQQVLMDLLPVLKFIHGHQVIHRDIKPENIMRRHSDQKLILIDFGAVKQATATSLQRTGTIIGSPAYQAPEQGMGKAIFSSDLYSLGVSCLQLLTNMEPFDLYDAHAGEFVWRNYLLYQKVPDSLGKVLDQMTQGGVKDRYKSAQEVWQALHPPAQKASLSIPKKVSTASSVTPFTPTLFFGKIINKITGNGFIENLGSGVQLEMIAIPGGNFQMGSQDHDREKPAHLVSVRPFYFGKYAVTQAQYLVVMGKNPSRFKGAKLPVERVSWHDAIEFCQQLSLKTGKNYRLPSEAEWEYACRAGTQTKYYFGDDARHLGGCGWYNGNSNQKTHPVGRRSSNQFGLYDMQGNVWEWCADTWHDNYHLAPTDGTAWIDNDDRSHCVIRGGSWNDNALNCRSALRNRFSANFSYNNIGFRLCI